MSDNINIELTATDEATPVLTGAASQISGSFSQLETDSKSLGDAYASAESQAASINKEYGYLDTTVKNTGMTFTQQVSNTNSLALAGTNLYLSFDRVQNSAVQLDRAHLMLEKSTNTVRLAEEALTTAVAKYGVDSPQAIDASTKLGIARDALTVATERVGTAERNYTSTLATTALSVIPSVIAIITGLITARGAAIASATAMAASEMGITAAELIEEAGTVTLSTAVWALASAFLAVAWPFLAIAAVGAALYAAYTYCEPFRDAINAIGSVLRTALLTSIEGCIAGLTWFWNNVLVPIGNFLRDVLIADINVVVGAFNALAGAVNAVAGWFIGGYSAIANWVAGVTGAGSASDDASKKVDTLNTALGSTAKSAAAAGESLSNCTSALGDHAREVSHVTDALNTMTDAEIYATHARQSMDEQVRGGIAQQDALSKETDAFSRTLTTDYNNMQAQADTSLGAIHDAFEAAMNAGDMETAARLVETFRQKYHISMEAAKADIEDFKDTQATAAAAQQEILQKQADSINSFYTDKFIAPTQKYKDSLAATAADVDRILSTQNGNVNAKLAISTGMIQSFADQWGYTWQQADTIITGAVGKIETEAAKVPQTIEEQLVSKAQDDMQTFKDCMSDKSLTMGTDIKGNLATMAGDVTDLINSGLVGEAQTAMQTYVDCNTNKVQDMATGIDATIAKLSTDYNAKVTAMTLQAENTTGAEHDAIIAEIGAMTTEYNGKVDQLRTWQQGLFDQMKTYGITNTTDMVTGIKAEIDVLTSNYKTQMAALDAQLVTATDKQKTDILAQEDQLTTEYNTKLATLSSQQSAVYDQMRTDATSKTADANDRIIAQMEDLTRRHNHELDAMEAQAEHSTGAEKTAILTQIDALTTEYNTKMANLKAQQLITLTGMSTDASTTTAGMVTDIQTQINTLSANYAVQMKALDVQLSTATGQQRIDILAQIDLLTAQYNAKVSDLKDQQKTSFDQMATNATASTARMGQAVVDGFNQMDTGSQLSMTDMSNAIAAKMVDLTAKHNAQLDAMKAYGDSATAAEKNAILAQVDALTSSYNAKMEALKAQQLQILTDMANQSAGAYNGLSALVAQANAIHAQVYSTTQSTAALVTQYTITATGSAVPLAGGGIVTGQQLAVIAEKSPEAVIPLEDLPFYAGKWFPPSSGGNLTITGPLVVIQGNADESTAKLAAELVMDKVRRIIQA